MHLLDLEIIETTWLRLMPMQQVCVTAADDSSKAVRQEAARAVGSLVNMQKLHAQPLHILGVACSSAEECVKGGSSLWHWLKSAHVTPRDIQHIDVVTGLEQVQSLTSAFLINESDEDVQVFICRKLRM